MVHAVIIIFKGGKPSVLVGPEVPFREQRKKFKELSRSLTSEDGEKIELWNTSTGRSRRKRLKGVPELLSEPDLNEGEGLDTFSIPVNEPALTSGADQTPAVIMPEQAPAAPIPVDLPPANPIPPVDADQPPVDSTSEVSAFADEDAPPANAKKSTNKPSKAKRR